MINEAPPHTWKLTAEQRDISESSPHHMCTDFHALSDSCPTSLGQQKSCPSSSQALRLQMLSSKSLETCLYKRFTETVNLCSVFPKILHMWPNKCHQSKVTETLWQKLKPWLWQCMTISHSWPDLSLNGHRPTQCYFRQRLPNKLP